jgi:hypothetical protein
MGRDDRDYESKPRRFGRIDPFCLFAVIPLGAVGIALIFSDVPILAPVLIVLAGLIVLLDSWLHRPGRLIDPRTAKQALRRSKELEEGGSGRSDIRRGGSRYDTGAQSQVRRSTPGASGRQPNRQQQPRQRQGAYREPQRGRSRY